ncbi:hypothetical protein [Angustibacter sp. Root456]|uniref:hypothetical protein n=1 Tax=Angustibacter sp. Root456 TaxID=1736539 RepID=UPI0006F4422C|nr:hypothetical protein [Angustibacter sp. Root456]KQX66499.1 hypothetical protein ASD06_03710 [Angustibacter sp. Root456]
MSGRRRNGSEASCWLDHLGPVGGGGALRVAVVTGSEAQASAWLDAALAEDQGRSNLVDDHTLHGSPGGIGPAEHVRVHVVLSGPDDDVQVHDVYLDGATALDRCEELRRRGIDDVRLLSAVTNSWV